MLSFTADVFVANLAHYNQAIWPAQIVATLLGFAVIALTFKPRATSGRIIGVVLATAWLWTGALYHGDHFARINFVAPLFGLLFVVQGLLIGWTCAIRGRLEFRFRADPYGWIGLAILVLGLAIYPVIGWTAGHTLPSLQTFGVTPLPTTIFTIGLLLMTVDRSPLRLLVIPLLWSVIDGVMAWQLAGPENLLLPLVGAGGLLVILVKRRRFVRDP